MALTLMSINEKLIEFENQIDRQEALEHRDTLLAINSILREPHGEKFFKYLFKNLEVGNLPDQGLEDNRLHESLGFLRAGNSIYKLVCESDPEIAGNILSKIERERYERIAERSRIENGLYDDND